MAPERQTSDLALSCGEEREKENLHLQASMHQVLPEHSNIPAHHQQIRTHAAA